MSSAAPIPSPVPPSIEPPSFGGYGGEPGAIRGVSFWPRVGARVIDGVVHFLIVMCTGFLFGVLLVIAARAAGQSPEFMLARQQQSRITLFVFTLLGTVAYHTVCEGAHGSTLGKRLLSMVVVQEDGAPCRPGPALIRSFAYFFDSLFCGVIAYFAMQKTPQEQRHGDTWAHTIVCRRSDAPPQSLRSDGRFAAVFVLAAMVDSAVVMAGMFLASM